MARQTETGKSFEYACLVTVFDSLKNDREVVIENNKSTNTARTFFEQLNEAEKDKMLKAASAAVRVITRLEPKLENADDNSVLYLSIQEDSKGQKGDVRDVLCIRKENDWEIGFSCKHNHSAVKHSRLSKNIDFGEKWFGKPCTAEYFEEITPLFTKLELLKKDKVLWNELENKEIDFYIPLLNAFVSELQRLYEKYEHEIPRAMVEYLLGRNDFYKIIARNQNSTTQIQVFNFFGTLNQNYKKIKPLTKVPLSKLPDKFFDISYKDNGDGTKSTNTILVTCNNGWEISLRIHNASSKVEPSLKFDVTLLGVPSALYSIVEPWQ